jgi:hypothetical protein
VISSSDDGRGEVLGRDDPADLQRLEIPEYVSDGWRDG